MPELSDDVIIEGGPQAHILAALGSINFAWAQLDSFVSAALYSILSVDPIEFGILLGRVETQSKLGKLHRILKHRGERYRAEIVKSAINSLEELRPLRNAITHGRYVGRTTRGELIWALTADFVIDDEMSAGEMLVTDKDKLTNHLHAITAIVTDLPSHFHQARMREVFSLRLRTRASAQAKPAQGKGPKKQKPPHSSS